MSDFKGRKVVLYFYPKDLTPGCTIEACEFRDASEAIKKKGAAVLGVSADSPELHRKFAKKYKLNFPLLSDPEKKVCRLYGVWRKKSFMGKSFMGIRRTTFLINEQGRIAKIWTDVKPKGHAREILAELG